METQIKISVSDSHVQIDSQSIYWEPSLNLDSAAVAAAAIVDEYLGEYLGEEAEMIGDFDLREEVKIRIFTWLVNRAICDANEDCLAAQANIRSSIGCGDRTTVADLESAEYARATALNFFEKHFGAKLGSDPIQWTDRTEICFGVEYQIVSITQSDRVLWSHQSPTAEGDLALVRGGNSADEVRKMVERGGVPWWGNAAVEYIRTRWILKEENAGTEIWYQK